MKSGPKTVLKLYIDYGGIYASLAYSDVAQGQSYILHDHSVIDANEFVHLLKSKGVSVLINYISALGEKFAWDLIDSNSQDIIKFNEFSAERIGVSSYEIAFDSRLEDLASTLSEYIPEQFLKSVTTTLSQDIYRKIAIKMGYKKAVFVDINRHKFTVAAFDTDSTSKEMGLAGHFELLIDNEELVEGSGDGDINKFLWRSAKFDLNSWANTIYSSTLPVQGKLFQEYFFGFALKNLLDFSRRSDCFTDNFISKYADSSLDVYKKNINLRNFAADTLVVLSGEITRVLAVRLLSILLIDGLDLKNQFDLLVDDKKNILMWGENYFFGSNAKDILVSSRQIISPLKRVVVPSVQPGRGDAGKRKVVGRYKITDSAEHNESSQYDYFYSPEINVVNIPDSYKRRRFFHISYTDRAWSDSLGSKFCFLFDPLKPLFDEVLFDCRYKPVVYGPNSTANRKRFKLWNIE